VNREGETSMLSRVLTETEPSRLASVAQSGPGRRRSAARPRHRSESEAEARNAAVEQQVRQAYESGLREGEAAARQSAESQVREAVESWPPPWLKLPPRAATHTPGRSRYRAAFH